MNAAVVEQFHKPLVMRELTVPTPKPGQALVEIMASGVCHTDLHAAERRLARKAASVPEDIQDIRGANSSVKDFFIRWRRTMHESN
jgi:NADPH:quinone reductase-like Zn-dependent oxidoreductase